MNNEHRKAQIQQLSNKANGDFFMASIRPCGFWMVLPVSSANIEITSHINPHLGHVLHEKNSTALTRFNHLHKTHPNVLLPY